MRLATIILAFLLLLIGGTVIFVALHTRTAGYVTFTISFGNDTMPVSLAAALPSAASPETIKIHPTQYEAPKPQRKPPVPPKRNDLMPGDAGIQMP